MEKGKPIYGIIISVCIAVIAIVINSLIPYKMLGTNIIALLIGMILNPLLYNKIFDSGLMFSSKKILKMSIVLLGTSFSFGQILEVGKNSAFVILFTIVLTFISGYLLSKVIKLESNLSTLISVGTAICGGSAIASVAPAIEAKEDEIAYSISIIFLVDLLLVIILPIIGQSINIDDLGYGLWIGTAVNDTSSVLAAGYSLSNIAGDYSVIVKLTRTLAIIPTVLLISLMYNLKKSHSKLKKERKVSVFPWFILFFVGMSIVKSAGLMSDALSSELTQISKFLMVISLSAVGFSTKIKNVRKYGVKPALFGVILSITVVTGSLFIQQVLLG